MTYEYDELGRVVNRAINGVSETTAFDPLGRPTAVTNALGTFYYTFDGSSSRLLAMTYPNGQGSIYSYFDNVGDRRLQQITHAKGPIPISQFGYAYNAAGNIISWSQQTGADPVKSYTFGYDAADQLLSATLTQGIATLKTYGYTYDKIANRTAETIDGVTRQFSYNALNELTASSTGPAANATHEWDAANRITAIVQGANRSEFSYDGLSRRVHIVEKQNGVVTSAKRFVWCGTGMCEEWDATGANVTRRFYPQGVQDAGVPFFYAHDHLGSIQALTDAAGNVRAGYSYDPYGRRVKSNGDKEANFGFTGHYHHEPSDLDLAPYRYYDAGMGRWLSRDPLGETPIMGNHRDDRNDALPLEPVMHFGGSAGGSTEGAKTSQPRTTPWEPRRKTKKP